MSEPAEQNEPPASVVFQARAAVPVGRKIAAAFMLANAGIEISVSLFIAGGRGRFLPSAVIQALLAIYILRGSMRAVTWAQFLTALGAVWAGGVSFFQGEIAEAIVIVIFQAALLFLLASRPGKSTLVACSIILALGLAANVAMSFFNLGG